VRVPARSRRATARECLKTTIVAPRPTGLGRPGTLNADSENVGEPCEGRTARTDRGGGGRKPSQSGQHAARLRRLSPTRPRPGRRSDDCAIWSDRGVGQFRPRGVPSPHRDRVRVGRHQARRGLTRLIAPASASTSRAGVGALGLGEQLALLRRQRAAPLSSCQVRMVALADQRPLRFWPAGR
jgi:hypothetical protein